MDNDGSTEEEQLQQDIHQINEVLGNDDDGDDSDFDLEIEEREADVHLTLHDNELQLSRNQSRESPLSSVPFDDHNGTRHRDTSQEPSLENLLIVNQDSQQNLQELLIRVREELARNREEQVKVSTNASDHEPKNVNFSVRSLFRDYLENGVGKSPPDNAETKHRKATNMPNPFELPKMKWKSHQHEKLLEGVRVDGLKRKMQPLLNRQEILEAKMDRLSVPDELQMVYEEIRQINKELSKIEKLPTSKLLGDRFRPADWEFIANVDLDSVHSAEECQLQWRNLLHPSISRKMWTKKENEDLMKKAAEYEYEDWDAIAEELGTGRTVLQCLRAFQQLDPTFVKSNFTQEDDELLMELVQRLQVGTKFIPFPKVTYFMDGKTQSQVSYRWIKKIDPSIKSGKWSQEETEKLKELVEYHGPQNWARMADDLPGRTQFQIRHRWATTTNPDIKHGPWDYPETFAFLEKTQELGVGNWAKIAQALKKPGEKARPSINLLARFKQVIKSYTVWKARSCLREPRNKRQKIDIAEIDDESLYNGTILPDVVAFLHDRQKREEGKAKKMTLRAPCTVQQSIDDKRKRKRRRLNDDTDDDDGDYSGDSLTRLKVPPTMTMRQKALALKKEKASETTPLMSLKVRTQDIDKNQRSRGNKRTKFRDENQESQPKAEKETACTEQPPTTSGVNDSDDDLTNEEDMDNDVADLYDARNDDEDGNDSDSDTGDIALYSNPSKDLTQRSPQRPFLRGLSGWLKKLKEAHAARAAHIAARSQRIKHGRDLVVKHASTKEKENSVFDVPNSVLSLHLRANVGRKKLTWIDEELVKAVDPMWLCRNRSAGRHTKHSVKAQERTRQEKLTRADQKAMFGLLLQVFDVDINYTTALAKRSILISSGAKDMDVKQNVNQEPHVESDSLRVTSGQQVVTSGLHGVISANQTTTSGLQMVASGPQSVVIGLQGATHDQQGLSNNSQAVTSGLQAVTSGLQEGTSANQKAIGDLRALTSGVHRVISANGLETSSLQEVASSLQEVTSANKTATISPLSMTSGPQVIGTANRLQEVTMYSQEVTMDSQEVTSGQQVVISGPQIIGTAKRLQEVTVDSQEVTMDSQEVIMDSQEVIMDSQEVTNGQQVVTSGPQVIGTANRLQEVTMDSQEVTSGQQVVSSGPQTLTSPQGVTGNPQQLTNIPHGVTTGTVVVSNLNEMATVPQGVAHRPQGLTSGLQTVTTGQQGVASNAQQLTNSRNGETGVHKLGNVYQGVTNGPQRVTSGLQTMPDGLGVMSGPQTLTIGQQGVQVPQCLISGPQGVTIFPQGMTTGPQILATGPQALTIGSQALTIGPQGIFSGPQGVAISPQGLTSGPHALTNCPRAAAIVPQAVTNCFQGVSVGTQAITIVPQGVASSPPVLTSGPQGVTVIPQGLTTVPQELTSGLPTLTSGLQAVANGSQAVGNGSQAVGNGPQALYSGPQGLTCGPQGLTSVPQDLTSDPQRVTSNPQGVTSSPQDVTSSPQDVTSSPQDVTSSPQDVTSSPQDVTSSPQDVTSSPQDVTSSPQDVTSSPQDVTSSPQDVTSSPQDVTSSPQDVTSSPQDVTSSPQDVTSSPQDVTSSPQDVTSSPQDVTSSPQDVTSSPQDVTSSPQDVTSSPQDVTSSPQDVTSSPQDVTSSPHDVTSSSQDVTGGLQAVTGGLHEGTSNPSEVTIEQMSHEEDSDLHFPPLPTVGELNQALKGPDTPSKLKKYQQRDPVSGCCMNVKQQLDLLRINETRSTLPQNLIIGLTGSDANKGAAPDTGVTQNQSNFSLLQHGNLGTVQSLNTPVSMQQNTQYAVSTPIVPQTQYQLLRNNQTGQLVVFQKYISGMTPSVQAQGNVFQNSSTLTVPHIQTQVGLLPNRMPTPQLATWNQGSLIPILQSGPTLQSPTQLCSTQNLQMMAVQPSQTPLKSELEQGQHSASPLVITNLINPWTPDSQVRNTPGQFMQSYLTLPQQPLSCDISGNLQAPVQQAPVQQAPVQQAPVQQAPVQQAPVQQAPVQQAPVQQAPVQQAPVQQAPVQQAPVQQAPVQQAPVQQAPVQQAPVQQAPVQQAPVQQVQSPINVLSQRVHGTPVPQIMHTNLSGNAPTPFIVPRPDTLQAPQPGMQAVIPTALPSSAPSTGCTQFVQMLLHNGSKIVLTMDQYRSYQAGNLGNVSCSLFIPVIKSEKEQVQSDANRSGSALVQQNENQRESDQGPDQNQSEQEQVEQDSSCSAIHMRSSLLATSHKYPKRRKLKPLKRKLHTKDISLLPPNVATIQALTSLLFDRKNLESQQKVFISKFQKQFEKPQVEKEKGVCFRGYLASRNAAQGGLCQASCHQEKDSDVSLESIISKQCGPTCSNHEESEAPQESPSSFQSVEDYLAFLKKSDLHQILQRRFLSLFLWPGLLSSTRIKANVTRKGTPSSYGEQPIKTESPACSKQKLSESTHPTK